MTSPIPGIIAWPLIVFYSAVLIGRRIFVKDTVVDRMINRVLVWGLVVLLLREASVQGLVSGALGRIFDQADIVNVMRQVSFVALLLTVTGIYGIARIWAGTEPHTAWRQQWRYDLVAFASGAVILIAGTPARRHNQLIDHYFGWPAVIAWLVFYAPLLVTASLVCRVGVCELRSEASARERVIYMSIVALSVIVGLDAVFTPVHTALEVLRRTEPTDPQMVMKAWTFALAAAGAVVCTSVPLFSILVTRLRWDQTGRYCRRLHPLWADLTAAVPEVVLPLPSDSRPVDPATRLHRMIVEIRDSLQYLRRHSSTDLDPIDVREIFSDSTMSVYAAHIAEAIDTKTRGVGPQFAVGVGRPRREICLGPRDLSAELDQLVALARIWPNAGSPMRVHDDAIDPINSQSGAKRT